MTFLHLFTRIWWHIWILGWWGWGLVETGDLWLLEGDENGAVGIRIDRGKTWKLGQTDTNVFVIYNLEHRSMHN
jgi:hypothetical protein